MTGLAIAAAIFVALAAVTVRLLRADLERPGGQTARSALATWLVYLFHADTVAAAAFTDVARLPVPATPFLVGGLALAAFGWLLFLWATATLVREGGFEGLRTTRPVFTGPFRISRHPQNAGWTVLLLGIALASRSLLALGLVALFALFAARLARVEEQDLRERFGPAYAAYSLTTHGLLGRPRRAG